MNETAATKHFMKFVKLLIIVLNILLFSCLLGMTLIVVSLFAIGFFPIETVQSVLVKESIHLSIHIEAFKIIVDQDFVRHFLHEKCYLVQVLLIVMILIGIVFIILWQLRTLVQNIRNGMIFSGRNSKQMKRIAYMIIFLSITIRPLKTYFLYSVGKMVSLDILLTQVEWIHSIQYQLFGIDWSLLLSGDLLWIFSKIFSYGAFLQEEYDATV